MHIIKIDKPLIEVSWLNDHLTADNLVILNATLPKAIAGDKTIKEQIHRIPGARFFDIKNIFSNISAPYPNTWPGKEGFNQAAKDLGIQNNSAIVVYDEHGIYSSARAYWYKQINSIFLFAQQQMEILLARQTFLLSDV